MASIIVCLFHVFAVVESIFALCTYYYFIIGTIDQGYAGPWKYLTFLNMWVQIACFSLCLLCDLGELLNLGPIVTSLKKARNLFYSCAALPSCLVVFTTFWILYIVDKEMIQPSWVEEFIPSWANHMWHTAILIVAVDVGFTKYKFPSRTTGICLSAGYGLSYLAWIMFVQYYGGFYVYPFLAHLNAFQFVMFVLVELIFTWSMYFLGEFINYLTGEDESLSTKKKE
uniref:Androgen-induced gene 1 protein-like n=1 Tax=Phallusia mammillata TaxID=59560 RepID=A0A6F9D6M3_9ASCI|nr:androgen-induced gene 1 protein-like [Phallusia mammillata]